jgi:hypothetical protein
MLAIEQAKVYRIMEKAVLMKRAFLRVYNDQ